MTEVITLQQESHMMVMVVAMVMVMLVMVVAMVMMLLEMVVAMVMMLLEMVVAMVMVVLEVTGASITLQEESRRGSLGSLSPPRSATSPSQTRKKGKSQVFKDISHINNNSPISETTFAFFTRPTVQDSLTYSRAQKITFTDNLLVLIRDIFLTIILF